MRTRLLPTLVRSLLVLVFLSGLSLTNASPFPHSPPLPPRSPYFPRAVPPHPPLLPHSPVPHPASLPSSTAHDNRHERYIKPFADAAARYNLKFKKYSQWIKDRSKSMWQKHAALKTSSSKTSSNEKKDNGKYVSPYLTQFADKHDSWWSVGFEFGIMWRHVLWEVVPGWFRGAEPPQREDMFLLRAMEQPLYMSVDELPDVFKPQMREQGKDDVEADGKISSTVDDR